MNKILMLISFLALSGCSIIHHLDELQTMGSFAREKNAQGIEVEKNDKYYDALVEAINSGNIKNYPNVTAIRRNFGEPILKKCLTNRREQWLYRHAIAQDAKDKVYLYFDEQGHLYNFFQEKIQW